jgi:hypothetical protein
MKKTKPILAFLAALALLFAAACDQGLSPSSPDLGEYKDARTNQNYTNNAINGKDFLPTFNVENTSHILDAGTIGVPKYSTVKIDFSGPIVKASEKGLTIDILKGDEAAVKKQIAEAISFLGVLLASEIADPSPDGPPYNTFKELAYTVIAVEQTAVWVEITDSLTSYPRVHPRIKAYKYKISNKPLDTDNNGLVSEEGKDPIEDDDVYYTLTVNNNTAVGEDNPRVPPILFADGNVPASISVTSFALGGLAYDSDVRDQSRIFLAEYSDYTIDKQPYAFSEYIQLQKWNPSTKEWEASTAGQYDAKDGEYTFTITYDADTYAKYRVVAKDLHKFVSGEVQGFKRRFVDYPHSDGSSDPVTTKDGGLKVLKVEYSTGSHKYDFTVEGSVHVKENVRSTIFEVNSGKVDAEVQFDKQYKNVMIILPVETDPTKTEIGNLGLVAPLPGNFTDNFKLICEVDETISDPDAVLKDIEIASAQVRPRPGKPKDEATGRIYQDLVLTLDPDFTWLANKDVKIYAKAGIEYAGDDTAKILVNPRPKGSLGDVNSTIEIDGSYGWAEYGTINTSTTGYTPPTVSLPSGSDRYDDTYNGGLQYSSFGDFQFGSVVIFFHAYDAGPPVVPAHTTLTLPNGDSEIITFSTDNKLTAKESFEVIENGEWAYVLVGTKKIGVVCNDGETKTLVLGRPSDNDAINYLKSKYVEASMFVAPDINYDFLGILTN